MRNGTATFVLMLTFAATSDAQYSIVNAWPTKQYIAALQVDSSAPGLLASGTYVLDLVVHDARVMGHLKQGAREYQIPFSVDGCSGVSTPKWATRATARGLPPAAGSYNRRVELTVRSAESRACALVGAFTSETDPIPGGRPGGGPDQLPAPLPDLKIRIARPDPDDPTRLRVQIYNDGPGPAVATQVKFFYHKDGKVTTTQSAVPMLKAKKATWVTVGAGLPLKGADSVTVRADDPNMVAETNELNNGLKFK